MKEKIAKILADKKIKGKEGMVVLLLIGAILAVIAIPLEKKEDVPDIRETTPIPEYTELNDYGEELERQLEEILSCMEGVGTVKVMITLHASSKEVVEKDVSMQQDNDSNEDKAVNTTHISKEENTVYTDDGNIGTPYVVQEIYPEIEGVLVVAEGGDNSYVNLAITDAIQALFDIDVHKIKIVKMNTN